MPFAALLATLVARPATAVQVQIDFQATAEDMGEGGPDGEPGGGVQVLVGTLVYESTTPQDTLGNYPGAMIDYDLELIEEDPDGGGFFGFLIIEDGTGDLFVGTDSFEMNYNANPGGLGDNSSLVLAEGPTFNNSLVDATNQLLAAGTAALNLFDFFDSFVTAQTDFTPDDVFANFEFVEVTLLGAGSVAGDYNASGQVEQGDLDLVLQNWGVDTDVSGVPVGWTNDLPSGQIEQTELDGVLQNWGDTAAPDVTFNPNLVPEPSAVFALCLFVLTRRRQS